MYIIEEIQTNTDAAALTKSSLGKRWVEGSIKKCFFRAT